MEDKNNDKKATDALSEMRTSMEEDAAVQPSAKAVQGRAAQPEMANVPASRHGNNGMPTGRALRVFQEIDNLMAQFFQSLKVIDAQFGEYAQIFYNEANRLADRTRTEEEDSELLANLALGFTTTAIGKLWQTISMSKQLGEVKRILKNEANGKLKAVRRLRKQMPEILEVAENRFCEASYKEAEMPMVNLRNSLYYSSVIEFLIATYEAALNDRFQDAVPFPTYAWINRYLLYACLGKRESLVNDENLAGRQKVIDWLVSEAESAIQRRHVPKKNAYLFAKDSGVMAIAVCDYYPMEDEEKWSENEDFVMESESVFSKFLGLYCSAAERPDTPIAEAALNNETLKEMNEHFWKIAKTREEYEGNVNAKTWTFILICLLGFLMSFVMWDFKWYWSIVVGLCAGFIGRQFMSFAKLEDKTVTKLINISRTIRMKSYEKAGFVEMVNLAELERQTGNVWVGALLGGLIGIIGGPVGCVIGIVIGIIIASSKSDEEESDFSYDHIRVKTTKKAKFLLFVLVLANLYILADWLIGF